MISVGMIGTGWIADLHALALKQTTTLCLAGAYDVDSETLGHFCERNAIKAYSSVEELLNAPNIDVVYICTRHDSHPDLAVTSLKRGKHVFLEKPAALSSNLAKMIAQECMNHSKLLVVGFNMRVTPTIQRLKELMQASHAEPYAFRANMIGPPFMNGWAGTIEQGGGVLVCQGSHIIDLISDVMSSQVDEIIADTFYINQKKEYLPNAASIIVRMKNGARGSILLHDQGHHAFHVTPGREMVNLTVYSNVGTFSADAYGDLKWGNDESYAIEHPSLTLEQVESWGYAEQARLFARMLEGESTPLCTISEAVVTACVIDAAIESCKLGRWVQVISK